MSYTPQPRIRYLPGEKEARDMVDFLANLDAIKAHLAELDVARAKAEGFEQAANDAAKMADMNSGKNLEAYNAAKAAIEQLNQKASDVADAEKRLAVANADLVKREADVFSQSQMLTLASDSVKAAQSAADVKTAELAEREKAVADAEAKLAEKLKVLNS